MKLFKNIILLFILSISTHILAQNNFSDSIKLKYPFIVTDSSVIHNAQYLQPFFSKLKILQQEKKGTINAVHIGDSHIQADHFSGTLRQNFQNNFGNAGRGLIFPYRVAKTNEPLSYKTSTNTAWQAKRNVFLEQPMPIGLSGITIETGDSAAEIKIMVKDQVELKYGFNSITFFHEKQEDSYDIVVYDSAYKEIGFVNNQSPSTQAFTSTVKLNKLYNQVIIKTCARNTSQNCIQLYGMVLENNTSGILYHMIGVNGAEYRHYNAAQYFSKQLTALNPDLIILSLGTNEGYAASFESDKFYNDIDTLITSIKKNNPNASILLTTPGDSFRRTRKGRVKNPDMLKARNTIINYANKNNLAYWDLFAVMGGYGSMAKWFKGGLTAKDRLHFNGKGYVIQGELLYNAIIKAY